MPYEDDVTTIAFFCENQGDRKADFTCLESYLVFNFNQAKSVSP